MRDQIKKNIMDSRHRVHDQNIQSSIDKNQLMIYLNREKRILVEKDLNRKWQMHSMIQSQRKEMKEKKKQRQELYI